jgi:hypothetical protein
MCFGLNKKKKKEKISLGLLNFYLLKIFEIFPTFALWAIISSPMHKN